MSEQISLEEIQTITTQDTATLDNILKLLQYLQNDQFLSLFGEFRNFILELIKQNNRSQVGLNDSQSQQTIEEQNKSYEKFFLTIKDALSQIKAKIPENFLPNEYFASKISPILNASIETFKSNISSSSPPPTGGRKNKRNNRKLK